MQIKIFTIPITGGERQNEELNVFLRSKKILQVDKYLTTNENLSFWSFCIKYLDDANINDGEKAKIDYRQVLDAATFQRFSKLREIRKQIAQEASLPAYAIFTNEELSEMAKMNEITIDKIRTIKGVGEKKAEKYAQYFIDGITSGSTPT